MSAPMRFIAPALLLVFAAAGCGSRASSTTPAPIIDSPSKTPPANILPEKPEEKLLKIFGGQKSLEIMQQPKAVEAFRVESQLAKKDMSKEIGGYEILSGPVEVLPEHAQALAKILADPKSYHWEFAKTCEFSPGVAIRFRSEKGTTDVLLCLSCDQVAFCQNDNIVGGEDFDDLRGPILEIVKNIFPQDAEIQGLLTKRH